MFLQKARAFLGSALWAAVSAYADEPVREITEPALTIQAGIVRYATVDYSSDGRLLAVVNNQKNIDILDAVTGKQLQSIATTGETFGLIFAPDGRHLVSSGRKGVRFWQLKDGKEVRALGTVNSTRCAFSPMGGLLASGHLKGATVWDTSTWKEVCQLSPEKGSWYSSVSFHPDARRMATSGNREEQVKVWDVMTSKVVLIFEADHMPVYTTVFSGDGNKLAATTRASVCVWDVETGKTLFDLLRRNQYVAAFSRDSLRIATASLDHTITIHDSADGRELLRLKGHTDIVLHVAFSPNDEQLTSTSRDGTVRIWKLTSDKRALKP